MNSDPLFEKIIKKPLSKSGFPANLLAAGVFIIALFGASDPATAQGVSAPPAPISAEKILEEIQTAIQEGRFEDIQHYKPIFDRMQHFIEFASPSLSRYYVEMQKNQPNFNAGTLTQNYKQTALIPEHNQIVSAILEINPYINITNHLFVVANGVLIGQENLGPTDLYKIEELPGVKAIHGDKIMHLLLEETLYVIGADEVHMRDIAGAPCGTPDDCLTGKGIKVAVIDSGVDYTHPDFADSGEICTTERFLNGDCQKIVGGYDFGNRDPDPMDTMGHGTHVAGIIAADGVVKGIAPDAQIYAYKVAADVEVDPDNPDPAVFQTVDLAFFSIVLSALEKASDLNEDGDPSDHVDIVNLSLGTPAAPDDFVADTLSNAMDMGIIIVVAVGNSGFSGTFSTLTPGNEENIIGVGASCKPSQIETLLDRFGNQGCDQGIFEGEAGPHASFSSEGPSSLGTVKPDLLAPGHYICATKLAGTFMAQYYPDCAGDNRHIAVSGTSMASPVAAGAVALLKQKYPDWNPYQIKYTLKGTADDFNLARIFQGDGQVNILAAVGTSNSFPRATLFALNDLFVQGTIEIRGVATDYPESDFEEYILEYAEGFDQGDSGLSWQPLLSSSTPGEGVLGTLNTDNIPTREFTIRLRVTDKAGQESIDEIVLFKTPATWTSGWPQRILSDPFFKLAAPVFGDLDHDGLNEIIVGAFNLSDAKVYVFDIHGQLLWQKTLPPSLGGTPSLGDLDGNGELEIIYSGTRLLDTTRYIYVWNHLGEDFNSAWPQLNVDILPTIYWSPLTIADVDYDGKDEIMYQIISLFGGNRIYRGDGTTIPGEWENKESSLERIFYAYDLNYDAKKEIYSPTREEFNIWSNSGTLLKHHDVKISSKGSTLDSSVITANVDSDKQAEIIYMQTYGEDFILDGVDYAKEIVDENLEHNLAGQPIAADLDGDGDAEIIYPRDSITIDAIQGSGERISGFPVTFPDQGRVSLLAVNMDDDQDVEIVVSTEQAKMLYINVNNSEIVELPLELLDHSAFSHISLALPSHAGILASDIDKDNKNEILSIIYVGNAPTPKNIEEGLAAYLNSYVFLQETNALSASNQWEMYKHDARRSATLPGGPLPFRRGDSNRDGKVDVADPITTLSSVFLGDPLHLLCKDAADANDDGKVDQTDAIATLVTIFLGTYEIPAPGRITPGLDPTADTIGCQAYPLF